MFLLLCGCHMATPRQTGLALPRHTATGGPNELSHDFAIKLLKYGTFSLVRSTACTVLGELFPYLAQIISVKHERVCHRHCMTFDLSCDFAIKWLKYGTSCYVCTTAQTVLVEFFPYLPHMITSMRGGVASSDLWHWPISSRLFNCDVYFMNYIHMWQKYKLSGMMCYVAFPRQ